MKKLLGSVVVGIALLALPTAATADSFAQAELFGFNEVPPVPSEGYGGVFLWIMEDGFYFYVEYYNVATVPIGAHIHPGAAGVNGPVMLDFLSHVTGVVSFGAEEGAFDGFFPRADFRPIGMIETWEQAVAAILSGNAYFNIHSATFPGGEIRGQTFGFSF